MRSTLRICGLALAAAALLSSCGKKDSVESGGAGGVSTPTTYLFFTGGASAALGAVDPANATPAGLIAVEPSTAVISNANPVYAGSYDGKALQITGVHYHAVIYFKDVGGGTLQLFKASALIGGAPAPARVSSASFTNSGTTLLCNVAVYPDYANPDNSRIVYTQAGVDTGCSTADDTVSMATLSMSSATAPVPGPVGARVIRELRDNSGAITGWIMLLGANLRWYQADMAAFQPLAGSVTSVNYLASGAGKEFLEVNAQVRIFDGTATLKNPGNAATALPANFDCKADDIYLFCADTTPGTGRTIWRLPLDGSAAWTTIYTGSSETMTGIVLSESRVLFKDTSTAGQIDLLSVPKVPFGPPVYPSFYYPWLVCRFSTTNGDEGIFTSGARVYCSEYADSATRAKHVHEDGEDEVLITGSAGTQLYWTRQSGSIRGVNDFQRADRLLLMGQTSAGVNRLTSYDGPTGFALADLTNANTAGFAYPAPLGDANNGNTLVILSDSSTGNGELFFANNGAANSLVRLTTTANSEAFVGASGCTVGAGQAPDPLLPLLVLIALAYIWRRRGKRVR